jgi:hypothetical protein
MSPPTGNVVTFKFSIILVSGPMPKYMKLVATGEAGFGYPAFSSTSYGHLNSALGAGVGAAYYTQTPAFGAKNPIIQGSSSAGGPPILFFPNGTRRANGLFRYSQSLQWYFGQGATFCSRRRLDGAFEGWATIIETFPNILDSQPDCD